MANFWNYIFFHLCLCVQLSWAQHTYAGIIVKNISYLDSQIDPGLEGLSRDGGASVVLNERIGWLSDDSGVHSETAAYSEDTCNGLTILKNSAYLRLRTKLRINHPIELHLTRLSAMEDGYHLRRASNRPTSGIQEPSARPIVRSFLQLLLNTKD